MYVSNNDIHGRDSRGVNSLTEIVSKPALLLPET